MSIQGTTDDMEKTLLDSLEVLDVQLRQDERQAIRRDLAEISARSRRDAPDARVGGGCRVCRFCNRR